MVSFALFCDLARECKCKNAKSLRAKCALVGEWAWCVGVALSRARGFGGDLRGFGGDLVGVESCARSSVCLDSGLICKRGAFGCIYHSGRGVRALGALQGVKKGFR